jgi:gentisate 1,2-dioxygenase
MSVYAERARFVPVEKGFNIKRPPIEPQAFVEEMKCAFDKETATGFIPLDLSGTIGTDYPATTPFMLTRYARIRRGESLTCTLAASGELWAVLQGKGRLVRGDESLAWCETEMLALPGGVESVWQADEDSVLWMTTDEPTLAFEGVQPETKARAPIEATHYQAEDIAREVQTLYNRPMTPEVAGRALFMTTARTEQLGTCLPAMTLTLNAVRPGESQRPHRHNAAAIVLALRQAQCASTIGGRTFPWTRFVTMLTPAGVEHEHCNSLDEKSVVPKEDIALALIVQDGGLYYYGRTMGFAFV